MFDGFYIKAVLKCSIGLNRGTFLLDKIQLWFQLEMNNSCFHSKPFPKKLHFFTKSVLSEMEFFRWILVIVNKVQSLANVGEFS